VKRPPEDEGEIAERDPDAGFTRRGQKSFLKASGSAHDRAPFAGAGTPATD
jgi:hypothetical protein